MNGAPRGVESLPERATQVSDEILAYDQGAALAATTRELDPARWEMLEVDARWWVIGEGEGSDQWLLGPDDGVWFWDGNFGLRAPHLFEPVKISVTEWLMLGHALGRFQRLADPSDIDIARLDALVDAISPGLAARYPYALPFAGADLDNYDTLF